MNESIKYLEDNSYCQLNLKNYNYGDDCPICGKELTQLNENKCLCCDECGCGTFFGIGLYYLRTYIISDKKGSAQTKYARVVRSC